MVALVNFKSIFEYVGFGLLSGQNKSFEGLIISLADFYTYYFYNTFILLFILEYAVCIYSLQ